jgi:hypothetical protein
MIYALPRTRIVVDIEVVKHNIVPGPYNAYADKYLGIKNVPQLSRTEYELASVALSTFSEADPEYYYSLTSTNPSLTISAMLRFCEQGLILDARKFIPFSEYQEISDEKPEPYHFLDLSVKKNMDAAISKEEKNTGRVPADLPVTKSKTGIKPLEVKAREAADFIIKIRKRRFKLMAGQYDVFPEGTALETAIRELNELEKEYLSLFIGKTYTDTLRQNFYYAPKSGQDLERSVICRFSNEDGLTDPNSTAGKPLVLELKSLNYTDIFNQVQFPQTGPVYQDVIFYRLPESALIRLFYGSATIVESEASVFQYGPLVPVSASLIQVQ